MEKLQQQIGKLQINWNIRNMFSNKAFCFFTLFQRKVKLFDLDGSKRWTKQKYNNKNKII